jgi:hypothetical protein
MKKSSRAFDGVPNGRMRLSKRSFGTFDQKKKIIASKKVFQMDAAARMSGRME